MRVPFLDLSPANERVKGSVLGAISDLVDSGTFTNGPQVREFEQAFASFCGARHCVGVSSGLDAVRLALLASGIQPGDEVIVPAATFVASFGAITQAGGVPAVVDVTFDDNNIDVAAVEDAVTERTRFVLPVHLYGQMADMRALEQVCQRHGLRVVEDACQAHGASRDGRFAGTVGAAGCFSFYPGKNLGAFGDGGALVTDDAALAERVVALREHGQTEKNVHRFEGYTARLDTLQGIVLLHKLPLLDRWNEERREIASFYSDALDGIDGLQLPGVPEGSNPVWHLYVVRTSEPLALSEHLRAHGIEAARHYPQPPHLSPAYAWLGKRRGDFPVAESLAETCLSLPIFPGMTELQVTTVVDAVRDFFRDGR
jgi:dTDP-4-amino-4,6-dideoxygalactose transaminase